MDPRFRSRQHTHVFTGGLRGYLIRFLLSATTSSSAGTTVRLVEGILEVDPDTVPTGASPGFAGCLPFHCGKAVASCLTGLIVNGLAVPVVPVGATVVETDLKNDLRRNESVTEQVERSVKTAQRETEQEMRDMRKAVREDLEKARNEANAIRKEMADARKDIEREVVQLKKEVDNKIQKAIDNPLANK